MTRRQDAEPDDPTEISRWRPVFRLLSDMDDEIARVYADNGIEDLKPSWVLEIVRLHARGPMTIAELARSVGRTHSALSQKVAAMRAARLAGNHRRPRRPQQDRNPHPQGRTRRRPPGSGVARHRSRHHRPGSRTPLPPDPGRRRHPRRPHPQVLPRPHHREAVRQPGLDRKVALASVTRSRRVALAGLSRSSRAAARARRSARPCSCASCRPAASPWGYGIPCQGTPPSPRCRCSSSRTSPG